MDTLRKTLFFISLGVIAIVTPRSIFAPNYSQTCTSCVLASDKHTLECDCSYNYEGITRINKARLNLDNNIGEVNGALNYGSKYFSKSPYLQGCKLTGPMGTEKTGTFLRCTSHPTQLDLNYYIGNNTGSLAWGSKNYSTSCTGCSLQEPNPATGIRHSLQCSCIKPVEGAPLVASPLNLDDNIGEKNGLLTYPDKNFSSSKYLKGKNCDLAGTILSCEAMPISIDLNNYISNVNGELRFDY